MKRLDELAEMNDEALGWWSISGVAILEALYRVADGDHPEVVYLEMYSNSDHSAVEED